MNPYSLKSKSRLLRRAELLFQGLNLTKLFSLHDHCVVCTVHPVLGLSKLKSVDTQKRIHSSTYCQLDVHHRMVQTGTDDTNQLITGVYCCRSRPLLIVPFPLLHTAFHLCRIVGSQGQTLETMMSSDQATGDEVVQRQPVEGPLRTPWTLHSLEDSFGCWISPTRIVASNPHILDIIGGFEPLC